MPDWKDVDNSLAELKRTKKDFYIFHYAIPESKKAYLVGNGDILDVGEHEFKYAEYCMKTDTFWFFAEDHVLYSCKPEKCNLDILNIIVR